MTAGQDKAWEVGIATAGLLIILATWHTYRFWNVSGRATARTTFSAAEASLRIESDKAILASRPDDLNALTDLAIACYQKGRGSYVEGLNALEKARALGATNESLFFYAGVMFDALGLPEYAANEFQKYLRHYPDDYEAMVRLANARFEEEKFDEALAIYQQAISRWPKDVTAWFNFAVVNIRKGNADAGQKALDRVKDLAGMLPEGGDFEEGEIAKLKGNEDAAMAAYQRELAAHSGYMPALEALENLQKKKGLWKDAQVTHKKILDLKHAAKAAEPPPAPVTQTKPAASVAPAAQPSPAIRITPAVPATPAISTTPAPAMPATPAAPTLSTTTING